jgi:serine/threonine protein kinase
MAEALACPDPATWRQLLEATLDEPQLQCLTRHLDSCSACRQTVDQLAAQGQSWSSLPIRALGQAATPEPALTEVMAKLKGGDAHGAETLGEPREAQPPDADLEFLKPSTKPGHLGRLGHFEIQEVIGKGGFGIVLKAFDEKLHRVVAIKVLLPELAARGTARKRFVREARTATAVSHDHVVGIYAVDADHRPPFLVMQFIDGVSLQDKLDKTGSLGIKEILRIGVQTAEGLAAAHKQGLVHRDIKPANILLENGVERVKITDFGLGRAVDDASVARSGVVAGTPAYMSPEQAGGEHIDDRSDLFSLGSVLYVMCTGRPPFRASATMAVLLRVMEDKPRPIQEINQEIPPWLVDIITKLHAKKPEERYQSAKEVAEVLGQHLAELQFPGRDRSATATAERWRDP